MAYLCTRVLGRQIRDKIPVVSRLCWSKSLPHPEDLATGHEKFEMEQIKSGNLDPFKMMALKRQASTKANPNIVHSYYDCRIVGCICEEDSGHIVWMWLFKGEPRRCMCGHWFKLEKYKPF